MYEYERCSESNNSYLFPEHFTIDIGKHNDWIGQVFSYKNTIFSLPYQWDLKKMLTVSLAEWSPPPQKGVLGMMLNRNLVVWFQFCSSGESEVNPFIVLLGPLWLVVPIRVPSMDQADLFGNYLY